LSDIAENSKIPGQWGRDLVAVLGVTDFHSSFYKVTKHTHTWRFCHRSTKHQNPDLQQKHQSLRNRRLSRTELRLAIV